MLQRPFFVYGTLLPGQPNFRLWQDDVEAARAATLHGALLYDVGHYPMLVETADDLTVSGSLVTVAADAYAEVVARIDALEGYDPAEPDAGLYRRVARQVETVDGKRAEAWVYVGRAARSHGLPRIPDGDWVAHSAGKLAEMERWWEETGRLL